MKVPNFTFLKAFETIYSTKNVCNNFNKKCWKIFSIKCHSFMCWQFKYHMFNLLNWKFKIKYHIVQYHTVILVQNKSVRMLKCRCTHAQLTCTCSPENVHMLKCRCVHAHLVVCTCSSWIMYMLKCRSVNAHLKVCACSSGSMHMLKCTLHTTDRRARVARPYVWKRTHAEV